MLDETPAAPPPPDLVLLVARAVSSAHASTARLLRHTAGHVELAIRCAAARVINPGATERRLRNELATVKHALAIEETRSIALERQATRALQLAAAAGVDVAGRAPAPPDDPEPAS